ncbi:hypothetical protein MUK42_21696 [Musa troglodytarum]|uniref:Uncharacterized protein n=1 Tax=Musa troglodytarum TaxID=320322 RepID=A0A9E7KDV0_9LILI|nr:hypothetical protein MUK42_21697 [Musa troglodytarum]URE13806.1 hypothetical protein MUK42_21696 [Musa troglodytarum]
MAARNEAAYGGVARNVDASYAMTWERRRAAPVMDDFSIGSVHRDPKLSKDDTAVVYEELRDLARARRSECFGLAKQILALCIDSRVAPLHDVFQGFGVVFR